MEPLSPRSDYDSDDTLRPLTALLSSRFQPPTPQSPNQKSPYTTSSIEILSPTFSSSDSGSEPSSPTADIFQMPLPWYRRIIKSFWGLISSIKSRLFRQPATNHQPSPPYPTSSTSSGFNSPSILKAPPAPPPILVPPPPRDMHLAEYFPLLSPRVSGLWKRRRTSSTPKSSPAISNFSPSLQTEQVFSPQASNWPPPLESPSTPYSDDEDVKDGEYVTIGKVISPTA